MSLTRKFLSAMGIEADKVDEIINAHLEVVNNLKEEVATYKEDAEKLTTVQKELEDSKKEVETLKNDEYKGKYDALQKEFNDFKEEQSNKEKKEKVRTAYKALLKTTGVDEKRIDTVLKVTDLTNVKVGEDGAIEDSEKLAEGIKKEWEDFIITERKKGASTENPPSHYENDDLGKMSMEDYIKARKGE